MSTTHTPGPWKLTDPKNPGRSSIEAEHNGALVVAGSYDGAMVPFQGNGANAHLIAAAPDLLAALDNLQSRPNDPAAHRMALDAMAKARGN